MLAYYAQKYTCMRYCNICTHDLNYEVIQVYNTQILNTNTGGYSAEKYSS